MKCYGLDNFYWVIVSSIFFGVSILLKKYLNKQKFTPEYGKPTDFNLLGTFCGMGSDFYGGFRNDGNSEVKYIFLCLFSLPIMPIACRRVTEGDFSWKVTSFSTKYKIYGKEKWSLIEIFQIYLNIWGGASLLFSILAVIGIYLPEMIRKILIAIVVFYIVYRGYKAGFFNNN